MLELDMKILGYFYYYYMVSGIIFCTFFNLVIANSEDFKDHMADIRWHTGLSDDMIILVGSVVSMCCGFYFLPKKIIKAVLKQLGIIIEEDKK